MNTLTGHATRARTAVSVTGLRKAYGEKIVLDGVDLTIAEGEVFALLGPNGAGKTTIVRLGSGSRHRLKRAVESDPVQALLTAARRASPSSA